MLNNAELSQTTNSSVKVPEEATHNLQHRLRVHGAQNWKP